MLRGKIISIEYRGVWILIIDGHYKRFPTFEAIEKYLIRVIKNAKDEEKKKLLWEDMKKLLKI